MKAKVSEKVGLKLHIQKTKNMAFSPITSWQTDGEIVETVWDYFGGAPKSLQMVTAAMKLEDTCSLEEKLWPTSVQFSSIQSLSHVRLFAIPWTTARQASLSIYQRPESTQTHVHRVGDAIQLSHPLSPPSPPALNLCQHQGLFKWVSSSHQVAKVLLSFSFNISPSNEHAGLFSFRMDWLDLLAVQGTLKSLLQHHSSKASILRFSAFFTVQVSHRYMTIGKTIALARWTFVGKVMSLFLKICCLGQS